MKKDYAEQNIGILDDMSSELSGCPSGADKDAFKAMEVGFAYAREKGFNLRCCAIQEIRSTTGWGLKKANDFVKNYEQYVRIPK